MVKEDSGYYIVKYKDDWVVGYFNEESGNWYVAGNKHPLSLDPSKISGARIVTPDEIERIHQE